jgi:MoxR-like ATPase
VIVGQEAVIEQVLMAVFCRGHALLVGVPGLAKTMLVSTLAQALDLSFRRIQFTPDLMPADITGTEVLEVDQETGRRSFRFVQGPVFTNMLLADEINRTPPKTQAALLEAMQERHVTVGERTLHLPAPFFVLATQNPIEQEGTYPLPEAQLDRFLFNITVDYPSESEEREIIRRVTGPATATITPLMSAEDIIQLQEIVKRVPVGDHVIDFAAALARATRPKEKEAPDFVKDMVAWGAGPRAGIGLISAAKAHAVLRGRFHATTRDVAEVAAPVLRHRVLTTFNAEAAGITSDEIIKRLLTKLAPREDLKV